MPALILHGMLFGLNLESAVARFGIQQVFDLETIEWLLLGRAEKKGHRVPSPTKGRAIVKRLKRLASHWAF